MERLLDSSRSLCPTKPLHRLRDPVFLRIPHFPFQHGHACCNKLFHIQSIHGFVLSAFPFTQGRIITASYFRKTRQKALAEELIKPKYQAHSPHTPTLPRWGKELIESAGRAGVNSLHSLEIQTQTVQAIGLALLFYVVLSKYFDLLW